MKNLKRMIAGALGVATVGAFAASAPVAKADSSDTVSTTAFTPILVNPGDLIKGVIDEPTFAEYHQEGYTRELDRFANRFEVTFACSARLQRDYGLTVCHGYRFCKWTI